MDDLRKIVRGLRLTARAAERSAGISGAQLFVLQMLAAERAPSLGDLAERTCTDQSSVSVVVRRLVDRGLVARKTAAGDARKIELELTRAGRTLLKRCPEPTQTKLVAALSRMKPSALEALREGLATLTREVGIDAEPARMFFDESDAPRVRRARSRREPK
jgi:MarR family transcriptional regulator, lower aerobic nicotinate degradation pathway regulator